jgi:hypothetical protein
MEKHHQLLKRVRRILEEATDVLGQPLERAGAKDVLCGGCPQERDELGL